MTALPSLALVVLMAAAPVSRTAAPALPVPIKDPVTVAVMTKLSDAQLHKAVRATLLNRGWKLDNERPGYVEAALKQRKGPATLRARVSVTWDQRQIVVSYLSSEGLAFDSAAKTILPDYNAWMDTLSRDFPVYLSLVTSE